MIKSGSLLALTAILLALIQVSQSTPLDDYVYTPDPHYKYEILTTYQSLGARVFVLNMTSQKWLDETIVKNPIWWHIVRQFISSIIKNKFSLLVSLP